MIALGLVRRWRSPTVRPVFRFVLQQTSRGSPGCSRQERLIAFNAANLLRLFGIQISPSIGPNCWGSTFRLISTGRFWPRASRSFGAWQHFLLHVAARLHLYSSGVRPPRRTGHYGNLLITMTLAGCGTGPSGTSCLGTVAMARSSAWSVSGACGAENGRR